MVLCRGLKRGATERNWGHGLVSQWLMPCLGDSNQQATMSPSTSCQSPVFTVTLSQICSLSTRPKPAASKRGRPKGTVSVITSSTFRMNLVERRNRGDQTKPRSLFSTKNKETNQTSQPSTAGQARRRESMQLPQEGGDDYTECIFCVGKCSEETSGEQWIKCPQCLGWCHEDCAAVQALNFVCDLCKAHLKVSEV
jgi:hypothetical protein